VLGGCSAASIAVSRYTLWALAERIGVRRLANLGGCAAT
jgi:hypothetical protein